MGTEGVGADAGVGTGVGAGVGVAVGVDDGIEAGKGAGPGGRVAGVTGAGDAASVEVDANDLLAAACDFLFFFLDDFCVVLTEEAAEPFLSTQQLVGQTTFSEVTPGTNFESKQFD